MAALRPFERDLSRTAVAPPSPAATTWQNEVRAAIQRVEVDLVGVLGEASMTLRELLELQPGDLLRLDRDPAGTLDLWVQDVPKLAVRPTVRQGNMAVIVECPLEEPEDADETTPPGAASSVAEPGAHLGIDDDADPAPGEGPAPLPSFDEQV